MPPTSNGEEKAISLLLALGLPGSIMGMPLILATSASTCNSYSPLAKLADGVMVTVFWVLLSALMEMVCGEPVAVFISLILLVVKVLSCMDSLNSNKMAVFGGTVP